MTIDEVTRADPIFDMKTLLFCTSYAATAQQWSGRYRKWLNFFLRSELYRDQILIIDDGSPTVPTWRGVGYFEVLPDAQPSEKTVLFHFRENLGRPAILDYPGWFRSFVFAAEYARKYGFNKIVHIESDCFLYSPRIVEFVNNLALGWVAFWCPRWSFPETCIQVVCADQLSNYLALGALQYSESFCGKTIETLLPFTHVRKDFIGDRYGEYLQWVPEDADYACQIPDEWPA